MELYETISLQCAYYAIRTPIISNIVPTSRCDVKCATVAAMAAMAAGAAVPLSPHTQHMIERRRKKMHAQRLCDVSNGELALSFFFFFFSGLVRFIDVSQVMVIVSLNSKCRCRRQYNSFYMRRKTIRYSFTHSVGSAIKCLHWMYGACCARCARPLFL